MNRGRAVVDLRQREIDNAGSLATDPKPVLVPDRGPSRRELPRWGVMALVVAGVALGLGLYQSLQSGPGSSGAAGPAVVTTVAVESKRFEATLRAGGTLGATNFALIRAPRMRGGRDRGGGGGGGGGGSSLTIASLAEPGTMVEAGAVVAEFESKRTQDIMDTYLSGLAQTRRRTASRFAVLMSSSATLEQSHRRAVADAQKSKLELGTAEVRSKIQAEILALQADQDEAAAQQMTEELRLSRVADNAERRFYEIEVEQEERRLARTESDMDKMRLRTPVSGLVVVETMFQRDTFSQASEGDTVYPGSTFLRVVDLSQMAVYADINQVDAQLVELGSLANVMLDAYPGVSFAGRVSAIGAMASSGKSSGGGGGRGSRGGSRGGSSGDWVRQVPIQIELITQDDRIRPDLSASADIIVSAEDDSLVIPRSALEDLDGENVVWVQDGSKFAQRKVLVGERSDTEVTVRSGLSAGDVIAVQPVTDPRLMQEPRVASKS